MKQVLRKILSFIGSPVLLVFFVGASLGIAYPFVNKELAGTIIFAMLVGCYIAFLIEEAIEQNLTLKERISNAGYVAMFSLPCVVLSIMLFGLAHAYNIVWIAAIFALLTLAFFAAAFIGGLIFIVGKTYQALQKWVS